MIYGFFNRRLKLLFVLLGYACLGSSLVTVRSVAAAHPLDSLPPGHWYEVPNSKLTSVNPCPDVFCPPGTITAVMKAWSGGAFDTTRDRLLVWGGGHRD